MNQPPVSTGALMNNGSRDTSTYDIQKLQQQLQDIKEQVSIVCTKYVNLNNYCSLTYALSKYEFQMQTY